MRNCVLSLLPLALCPLLVAQQTQANANPPSFSPAQAAAPTGAPQPHTLLDGTPVKLRLSQTISSANAKVGQEIPFEVVEEIKVDDAVVLPKGAVAIGTVTECNPKKSMGRAGKLNLKISYARLADAEKVALRATQDNKGGGHVGAMTGAMVATAVVFFPAAPLFLFIKGKDITIPQGTEITAFIEGDMHLNMANLESRPRPLPRPPSSNPHWSLTPLRPARISRSTEHLSATLRPPSPLQMEVMKSQFRKRDSPTGRAN